MAIAAGIGRRHMFWWFAAGDKIVMTTEATALAFCMIETGGNPVRNRMAGFAAL